MNPSNPLCINTKLGGDLPQPASPAPKIIQIQSDTFVIGPDQSLDYEVVEMQNNSSGYQTLYVITRKLGALGKENTDGNPAP